MTYGFSDIRDNDYDYYDEILNEESDSKIKICEICDEESTCDYVKDYDHEVCCSCDDDIEGFWKYCASCFSGYASNVYDEVKARKER